MRTTPHVLVVDHDLDHSQALCSYLRGFGLRVQALHDGAALRRQLAQRAPDLLVLDPQLPGEDGLLLSRCLVARGPGGGRLPLILTAAGAQAIDRVIGLELGADDYLSKPFEPRELVARIHTVLRRTAPGLPAPAAAGAALPHNLLRFDGWLLQREPRRLSAPDGRRVPLPEAEFQLLAIFLQSPRRVCSREQLAAQARGRALASTERSIDLLVSRLRHKLDDDPRAPRLIQTVRGAGYLFTALPEPAIAAAPAAGSAAGSAA